MESLFCGGKFCFDYQHDGYEKDAAADYRAILLQDVDKLLRLSPQVRLSENLSYVGPYYFESDGMVDEEIVQTEMEQIARCSAAVFLLEDGSCPGTVAEMLYAASLHKRMIVFYVRNEEETESSLRSACWYPILLCKQLNGGAVDVVACRDAAEAQQKLLCRVREMM